MMSKIRSKNTKPEIILRSALHQLGFRFRLHKSDLPGKPDIVLPKYNTVIFVNGCFWHYHKDCSEGRIPNTNTKFWREKLKRNEERDKKKQTTLKKKGWHVLIVWECELENELEKTIRKVLQSLNTG